MKMNYVDRSVNQIARSEFRINNNFHIWHWQLRIILNFTRRFSLFIVSKLATSISTRMYGSTINIHIQSRKLHLSCVVKYIRVVEQKLFTHSHVLGLGIFISISNKTTHGHNCALKIYLFFFNFIMKNLPTNRGRWMCASVWSPNESMSVKPFNIDSINKRLRFSTLVTVRVLFCVLWIHSFHTVWKKNMYHVIETILIPSIQCDSYGNFKFSSALCEASSVYCCFREIFICRHRQFDFPRNKHVYRQFLQSVQCAPGSCCTRIRELKMTHKCEFNWKFNSLCKWHWKISVDFYWNILHHFLLQVCACGSFEKWIWQVCLSRIWFPCQI